MKKIKVLLAVIAAMTIMLTGCGKDGQTSSSQAQSNNSSSVESTSTGVSSTSKDASSTSKDASSTSKDASSTVESEVTSESEVAAESEVTSAQSGMNDSNQGTKSNGMTTYVKSLQEAEQMAGITFKELNLEGAGNPTYYADADMQMVEIDITYNGNGFIIRKAKGDHNPSPSLYSHDSDTLSESSFDDIPITIYTAYNGVVSVNWTQDGYSYSVDCGSGLTLQEFEPVMDAVIY